MTAESSVYELVLERAVSSEKRDDFVKVLVTYHLTELNGFGDQLRYFKEDTSERGARDTEQVSQRCRLHLQALRILGPAILEVLRAWSETSIEQPQDAFAFGFVLAAVGVQPEPWVEPLGDEARPHAVQGMEVAAACETVKG